MSRRRKKNQGCLVSLFQLCFYLGVLSLLLPIWLCGIGIIICYDVLAILIWCVICLFSEYTKKVPPAFSSIPLVLPSSFKGKKKLVDNMSGLEFEQYCASYLRGLKQFSGVQVTQASGDYGADIVARDRKGYRWVFQCKRYSSTLGNKPIQEVVAAKAHYKADYAAVITNSVFSDAAKLLARENGVVLYENIK